MADVHPPIRRHRFEVAITDWEHQVPAHGPKDHLVRKMPPLEGPHPASPPLATGTIIPGADSTANLATEQVREVGSCDMSALAAFILGLLQTAA
jgi:hypothetical protein